MHLKNIAGPFVYNLIYRSGSIERKQIPALLFGLQKNSGFCIAPFRITDDGTIESKVIELVINDFIALKYVKEQNGNLVPTNRSFPLFEDTIKQLPSNHNSVKPDTSAVTQKVFKMAIGSQNFSIKLQASSETRRISRAIPFCSEIAALSAIPMENYIFQNAVPLHHETVPMNIWLLLSPNGRTDMPLADHRKNIGGMYSFIMQTVGKSAFSKTAVDNALLSLSFALLPTSAITAEYRCANDHPIDIESFEDYIPAFLNNPKMNCGKCLEPSKTELVVIDNERFFDDWKNGVLMEWFSAESLRRKGIENVLWNFELNGEQCDAVAFDKRTVFVIECKRSNDEKRTRSESEEKLLALRELLEISGLKVRTCLVTNLDNAFQVDGADLVVCRKDFVPFFNDPLSFF